MSLNLLLVKYEEIAVRKVLGRQVKHLPRSLVEIKPCHMPAITLVLIDGHD